LGIGFFITMTVVMAFVVSSVNAMRDDEAEGYLDNLLVRPVGRLQWLWGRVGIIAVSVVVIGVLTSLVTWGATAVQHLDISGHALLLAGFNAMAPAAFTLGASIFALGWLPRLTSLIGYAVIAWSFLVQMISSGINLNHWILDTSIFHHVALAPAVDPNWRIVATLCGIGLAMAILGALRFRHRDLQAE
jgi:ABC-2 type transport system permease protein